MNEQTNQQPITHESVVILRCDGNIVAVLSDEEKAKAIIETWPHKHQIAASITKWDVE